MREWTFTAKEERLHLRSYLLHYIHQFVPYTMISCKWPGLSQLLYIMMKENIIRTGTFTFWLQIDASCECK